MKQEITTRPSTSEDLKEAFEAARMAELLRQPRTPTAKKFVNDVLDLTLAFEAEHAPRKQKIRKPDLESLRRGAGALLADLIDHAGNEASEGFMYRSKHHGNMKSAYCSIRSYERLLRLWPKMGWIDVHGGFQVWDDFDGKSYVAFKRCGRLRATEALLALARESGLTPKNVRDHFKKDHARSCPIEVKSRPKPTEKGRSRSKKLKLDSCCTLEAKADQLRDLNSFYEQHQFSLEDTPQLKRIFHNGDDPGFDYDQGGRLYCVSQDNYQSMAKAERRKITINGAPTMEVDVSSSFPFILHSKCNVPFPEMGDIYDISGIERLVVKKIVVARLGSEKWPTRWPKHFKREYMDATGRDLAKAYKLKDVVQAIRVKLPILDRVDQRSIGWAQLQYWESEAMLEAILWLKENHGVVALPIHDSLLVPAENAALAQRAIELAYQERFGALPVVKQVPNRAA